MGEEGLGVRDYMSYLLRLWRAVGDDGKPVWRATLETPVTREVRAFTDLGSLTAFLQSQTGQAPDHASGHKTASST
jgi:hypothetical protein